MVAVGGVAGGEDGGGDKGRYWWLSLELKLGKSLEVLLAVAAEGENDGVVITEADDVVGRESEGGCWNTIWWWLLGEKLVVVVRVKRAVVVGYVAGGDC